MAKRPPHVLGRSDEIGSVKSNAPTGKELTANDNRLPAQGGSGSEQSPMVANHPIVLKNSEREILLQKAVGIESTPTQD